MIVRPLTMLATLLLASFDTPANALSTGVEASPPIYAQRLVDTTVARHPELTDLIFHVAPPEGGDNTAIAAHTDGERHARSGADDLGVIDSGQPLVEVQKDGVRIGVIVPLHDQHGRTIGALGVMYHYAAGQDEATFLRRALHLRNQLATRIESQRQLFSATALQR